MNHSITLAADQRSALLRYYRGPFPTALRLRAHLILLLADRWPWDDIARALYCSTRTIARWKERFQRDGLRALPGQPAGAPRRLGACWAALVVAWVLQLTPRAFGSCFRARMGSSLPALRPLACPSR